MSGDQLGIVIVSAAMVLGCLILVWMAREAQP